MRTFVLIAVLGAIGLSAFLWSGTAHAQVRPPGNLDPCVELRLDIESGTAGPVADWPQERIRLGLFCAYLGASQPFVPVGAVAQVDVTPVNSFVVTEKPPSTD
jgi:hypothetical protein